MGYFNKNEVICVSDVQCSGAFNAERKREWQERRAKEIRAKFEAETKQIEQDRKDAPVFVIGLLQFAIEVYQAQANRLTGHDFDRNGVYFAALLKGKEALEKAFEVPSEDHDCARDGCPTGQGCDRNG